MALRRPSFFPQRVNTRTPSMSYYGGVEGDSVMTAEFGAPAALDSAAILSAQSINTALDTTTFVAASLTPASTLQFRVGTAEGAAATGDVCLDYFPRL